MSSYRCSYVSWCVDPRESSAPAAAAPTGTATLQHFPQSQQCASSGSVPLLILPPETSGGEATFHQQCPSPTLPKTKHTFFTLHNTEKVPNVYSDEGADDENTLTAPKGNLRQPEGDVQGKQEASLLHSEEENFLLPRSSPVISRRHRTVSCHGGRTDPSKPSSSPPCASLPLHQHRCPTATSTKNAGSKQTSCWPPSPVQIDEKQRCVSLSSNLNSLLSGHHRSHSGQPALAKDTRQRCLTTLPTLGPSTSALHNKESRGIPDFPADIYRTSCELEKENAHFIVVDMVLEVLEGAKWTLSCDRWTSMKDEHQHTECEMCAEQHTSSVQDNLPSKQTCTTQRHILDYSAGDPTGESYRYTHSDDDTRTANTDTHFSYGYQHTQGKEDEESVNEDTDDETKTLSVLSTDSGFEDSGLNTERLTSTDSLRNAEWLAQQLVSEFKRTWFPSHRLQRGRKSLCSSLQELPGTKGVVVSSSSLAKEIRLRTRMRGSLNWAPPRFQIIFTVQPTHRRSDVVSLQNFLCAGCGTEVEPRYIKKLRYCEYLGRYFCDCCHSGSEAVIPGRVLSGWDFSRYSVSDFSKQLLESVWHHPLFDLTRVGKTLYSRVKELDKLKEIQEQLMGTKKLLAACRLSGRVLAAFDQLPAHFMEQPLLFSMDDLLRVKKGQLVAQTRAVLHSAIFHVQNCELCQARGFICEFCREKDIIFPFQSDICKRCKVCKACFHKNCFLGKTCPKCKRIQSRMKVPMPP